MSNKPISFERHGQHGAVKSAMKGGRLFVTIAKFINEVGFKVREGDVKKVNDSIKSIKSTATKLLGAIGIGFSLTKINALVEEFGAANKQIKSSVGEMENMDAVQGQVLQKANAARLAYTDMAGYVSNLAKAGSDIFPVDDAIQFASTVAKLMKTNGRNDSAISSMMEGFNKSFQKGIVDTETLNKMLEQAPETANVLAQSLGVAKSQLLDMASNGKMTVQQLKDAFMDASGEIDAAFQNSNMSISDGLKNIRNNWGLWLTQMNSTLGVTNAIARAMVKFSDTAMRVMNRVRNAVVWLGDKLGGTDKVLKLLTITVGAFLIASKADKVVGFLKNAGSLLGKLKTGLGAINLKVVAIAAAIIILALLIEDFVNFMQGNDSLLGAMLEKAGIDADKVRETIQNAFQKVKDFLITAWGVIKTVLTTVWSVLKTVATSVFGGLQRFWEKHGEQIMTALANIWTGIKDRLILVWNIIKTVAMVVFGALKKFWDTWGESILTAFEAVWNVIKAVFGTAFDVLADLFAAFSALFAGDWEGFWENIKQYFADLWNGILNILGTILTGIWNVVSSVWSKIWEIVSNIATGIWESVTTAFTNMWNGVTTTVGNIKQSIVDGFTAAIDWIKSLPAQALQWGADIINNIVEGIKGAVGKVGEAVSGVAGKIKGFLGFSEPDEGPLSDFHTYMPDMIDLMTKGISAGKAKVRDALGALTGDMSIMAQANVASPTTARTAMGSNSVSKSVVQNVNINNKFEGDRAGQQKSAAAMDKAAGDSTGEMARALSYAR